MSKGKGKSFERDLAKAFRSKYPKSFVERIPDKMIGKGNVSVQSPPDLVVNSPRYQYLIECKVVKGISLSLSRLSPHQHDYLEVYDRISLTHKAYVAVCFYNGKLGKARVNRAWLVPIHYWDGYTERHDRKSIAMKHLEVELADNELHWVPAVGWEIPLWL